MQVDDGTLSVDSTLALPSPLRALQFTLNAGLRISTDSGALERVGTSTDGSLARYLLRFETPSDRVELQYHGRPVFSRDRLHGGMPSGRIAAGGVYLDGASAWYPLLDEPLSGVRLAVSLPTDWHSVSIGQIAGDGAVETWTTNVPHDDLYLIAGPFRHYEREHAGISLSVYLLEPDDALAERYLASIGGYIDAYSELIGRYPYAKFAVVENAWQTGYGMPSFTLLGSRVMRLPFIFYTSLPHEILHNWWGNGVWVDYGRGNWSEGLTAYLADHWMQERQGNGADYRLKALQRYTNFAARGADRPLIEFVSRHNDASQSIGYSKSMMLFHMLRMEIGDSAFVAGLRRIWQRHAFERIGFEQAIRTLVGDDEAIAQRYVRWLHETGAPGVRLARAQAVENADGWSLDLAIERVGDSSMPLELPVAVTLAGQPEALELNVVLDAHRVEQSVRLDSQPLRVDIDPRHDVLRLLDPSEQPPALNRLFGGSNTWLVLPRDPQDDRQEAWRALAEGWAQRYPGMRQVDDDQLDRLPDDADVILLGWDNRLLPAAAARFTADGHTLSTAGLQVDDSALSARGDSGMALVTLDASGRATAFLGAPDATGIAHLARKLPHYGSYGRLVFDLGGNNIRKDTLPARHSTLTRQLTPRVVPLQLANRAALTARD